MSDIPDIERCRRLFGLSRTATWKLLTYGRPLWDAFGGPDLGRAEMYHMWLGKEPVPAWVDVGVAEILHWYSEWKADVLARSEVDGEEPGRLTTHELAQLLDMTDYYIYSLRSEGVLSWSGRDGHSYTYTRADVAKLFATAEAWVERGHPTKRGTRAARNARVLDDASGMRRLSGRVGSVVGSVGSAGSAAGEDDGVELELGGTGSPLGRSFARWFKKGVTRRIANGEGGLRGRVGMAVASRVVQTAG